MQRDDNTHMSDASAPVSVQAWSSPRAARAATGVPSPSASASVSSSAAPPPPPSPAQSARMREAQNFFQRVVKQELQVLLARGVEREVAVRKLLHRIVESTLEPEAADVRRVMKQFQMNYDDAVRALIVKQEIGRLKRQGMDAFAAIEELTRKMQRVLTVERGAAPADHSAESTRLVVGDTTPSQVKPQSEPKRPNRGKGDLEAQAAERSESARHWGRSGETSSDSTQQDRTDCSGADADSSSSGSPDGDAELEEVEEKEHDDDEGAVAAAAEADGNAAPAASSESKLSPLSLCQRIDNVSISSDPSNKFVGVPPPSSGTATLADAASASATATDDARDASVEASATSDRASGDNSASAGLQSPRSRSPTSSNSSPALVSRKRRAAPVGVDGKSGSHHHHHLHQQHHTGPSTFPLFPSSKKQKLMEVGDGFLSVVSRKFAKAPSDSSVPSSSSSALKGSSVGTASGGAGGGSGSGAGGVGLAVNPHKRRRELAPPRSPGVEYPVSDDDELATAAHIVRLTKRHKSHRAAAEIAPEPVAVSSADSAGGESDGEPAGPAST
ncbi:hypothetical protein PybrP1_003215 [[Pythium] brassicae (nom. inval.)]|nr:hypothetical protein PybrP1_003215 [[Pythium] brassicae (nom. inval.)]